MDTAQTRAGISHLLRLTSALTGISAQPGDSDEVRLQKKLLLGGSFMILPVALAWGFLYLAFNELLAGLITLGYVCVTVAGILYLWLTGQHRGFANVQLSATLVLPFILTHVLGGFWNASAVILGALMSPLGALLYGGDRRAWRWFVAFVVLLIAAGFLQPLARERNNLPLPLITAMFVMNVAIVSSLAFVMMSSFIRQREQALEMLRVEQAKSERLLLNVLPQEVATILKDEDRLIADRFDAVSILFADVVGFTTLSAEMDPAATVELLNEVFSRFDAIVARYGLEKIRTIGDGYMVASGVPRPRPDHAQALAHAALEMLAYMETYREALGQAIAFRIGINSGPVVAGVIGRQKFHYDVWGDPVNTASRMETHGEPGKIQIGRATYELIKDEFICESRGLVPIKGRGELETWFLTGVKGAAMGGGDARAPVDSSAAGDG